MTSQQDIEIDYCPKCRGIWLDRRELDKLIDRSMNNHSDKKNLSEWNNGLRNQTKSNTFHSSSHQERRFKHGKPKSWLREMYD
jgi:Zn-finger nucleic acid-binding protein